MKNKMLYTVATLVVTVVFFSGLYLFYSERQHNFTCSANVTFLFEKTNQENEALLYTNMRFSFNKERGLNVITGHLDIDGRDYTVDRKIQFNYTKNKNNNYVLVTSDIFLNNRDNLPKDLAERYLYRFSTERHESTHLTIINLNNGKKLFSSATLPYFICE